MSSANPEIFHNSEFWCQPAAIHPGFPALLLREVFVLQASPVPSCLVRVSQGDTAKRAGRARPVLLRPAPCADIAGWQAAPYSGEFVVCGSFAGLSRLVGSRSKCKTAL